MRTIPNRSVRAPDEANALNRTDIYSRAKRSEIMSQVRAKDTVPERIVRRVIHRMGFRFRLHQSDLPGKPDIVLPRHRKVVLVNGCFWHQHPGCSKARRPQTRAEWWAAKLHNNLKRDRTNIRKLKRLGWSVCVIWECEVRKEARLESVLSRFLDVDKP